MQATTAVASLLGFDPGTIVYEPVGCPSCDGTGFKGRTAICELLDLSDRIREMILDRRPASEVKKAAHEEGMRFLRDLGFRADATASSVNRMVPREQVLPTGK